MRFEQPTKDGYMCSVVFEGEEIDVIASSSREYIFRASQKGNSESISRSDDIFAGWERNKASEEKSVHFGTQSFEFVSGRLHDYYENTAEAIADIPEITGVPPFLSRDIPKRREFGKIALRMAETIQKEGATRADIDDMESGLAELLSESPQDFGIQE